MKFEILLNADVAETRNERVVRIGDHRGYLGSAKQASVSPNFHEQAFGKPLISP